MNGYGEKVVALMYRMQGRADRIGENFRSALDPHSLVSATAQPLISPDLPDDEYDNIQRNSNRKQNPPFARDM